MTFANSCLKNIECYRLRERKRTCIPFFLSSKSSGTFFISHIVFPFSFSSKFIFRFSQVPSLHTKPYLRKNPYFERSNSLMRLFFFI